MSSLRYKTRCIAICALFLASLIISGCGKKEAAKPNKPQDDKILATVGDKVITIDDYKEEYAILPASYRDAVNFNKTQFLESLINKHLLFQEAKKKGIENSKDVKRLLKKVEEEIIIQEFLDKEISDRVEVTDAEIEKYYGENKNNYMEPVKIKASHILVDSEILATKIIGDIKEGADFAELAKEYSLDIPTKAKGGDLGYFDKGTLLAEFEEACDRLGVGEISEVVKTDLGYHVIKILDKKEAELKTLEDVKDDIKRELLLDKEISLYDTLIAELRKNCDISIDNELLDKQDLTE